MRRSRSERCLFLRRLLLLLPWVRNVRERDLQDELQNHDRFAAEEARADGLSPADAQAATRRHIGAPFALSKTCAMNQLPANHYTPNATLTLRDSHVQLTTGRWRDCAARGRSHAY